MWSREMDTLILARGDFCNRVRGIGKQKGLGNVTNRSLPPRNFKVFLFVSSQKLSKLE